MDLFPLYEAFCALQDRAALALMRLNECLIEQRRLGYHK